MSPALGSRRRAVVIGLDGAPYSLLARFAREGVMPELAAILDHGEAAAMDTAIPEISSVAWSSFMTGAHPARHGVYGFTDLDPRTYRLRFTNFHSVRAETVWDVAGRHGLRSVVLNVPSTYPARPLLGVLVSGFVAIDLRKATYPERLVPVLEGLGYQLDVDTTVVRDGTEALVGELARAQRVREQALEKLFDEEPWELYVGVVTETDRLHHYLWAAIEDEGHPQHGFFLDSYRRIDRFLGRMWARLRPDDLFLLMSDHGFCAIRREVYLNHWLRQEGYLDFTQWPPRSHADLADGSRAIALDPSRIHLHTRGRWARGVVELGAPAEKLREELKARLAALTVDGQPVVQRVFRREELYAGPETEGAPDLVLLPHRGFDLKGTIARDVLAGPPGGGPLTGMHTQDDAVVFVRGGIRPGPKPHVVDLAPTVLDWLGVPVPEGMEGRSLLA